MRLAYRYNCATDTLCLTNGSIMRECDLALSFGAEQAHTFFALAREFARFALTRAEFALLCAVKFFTNDRPLLIERNKVSQIQDKYVELFEHMLEHRSSTANSGSVSVTLAHVLLSFIKLRALDVLSKSSFKPTPMNIF